MAQLSGLGSSARVGRRSLLPSLPQPVSDYRDRRGGRRPHHRSEARNSFNVQQSGRDVGSGRAQRGCGVVVPAPIERAWSFLLILGLVLYNAVGGPQCASWPRGIAAFRCGRREGVRWSWGIHMSVRLHDSLLRRSAFALTLALAVSISAGTPDEAARADSGGAGGVASTLAQARTAAEESGQPVEALDHKSEQTSVLANPDGSIRVEASTQPEAVKDGGVDVNGVPTWQDIDTELEFSDGAVRPLVAQADMRFSDGGAGPAVEMAHGSSTWGLSWPGGLPSPQLDGDTVTYSGVEQDLDLRFIAGANGFSQRIILHEPPDAPPVYDLPISSDGMNVTVDEHGGIAIADADDNVVATSSASTMWDARTTDLDGDDPSHYAPVSASVVNTATGQVLRLEPDPDFLTDPATQYPVTIDPSPYLTTGDTFIRSGTPYNGHNYHTEDRIRHGAIGDGTLRRSFLKFNYNGELGGKHVVDAQLKLYEVSNGAGNCTSQRSFSVQLVSSGLTIDSVTWANQPTATSKLWATVTSANGYSSDCPNAWVSADITDLMQYLAHGEATNYGLRLRANDETDPVAYKAFMSQETGAAPKVVMELNSYPNAVTGRPASKVYYNSSRPCLTGIFSDPDGGTGHVEYEIWTRDSAGNPGTKAADFWGPTVASGTASPACVPNMEAALADGDYMWRAIGHDGQTARASGYRVWDWAPWVNIRVDTAAPVPPETWSAEFPADEWSYETSGSITATSISEDVVSYRFVVDGVTGAWTSSPTAAVGPLGNGDHTIEARVKDATGYVSSSVHKFYVADVSERALDPASAVSEEGDVILAPTSNPAGVTVTSDSVSTAEAVGDGTLASDGGGPLPAEMTLGEAAGWTPRTEPALSEGMAEADYFEGDFPCGSGTICAYYTFGDDERRRVTDTKLLANRRIGKLLTSTGGCTAFLIDANSIVTNGHCVTKYNNGNPIDDNNDGLIDYKPGSEYVFVPAMDGDSVRPYGRCDGGKALAPRGWRKYREWKYDYAVINLPCAIGWKTGWYGMTYTAGAGMNSRLAGYPGMFGTGANKGRYMYAAYGNLLNAAGNEMWAYYTDVTGGQSGSPLVMAAPSSPTAIRGKVGGVHSMEYEYLWTKVNRGVKLDTKKIRTIKAWAGRNGIG